MTTWGTREGRTNPHERARILARDVVCQLHYDCCLGDATMVDHVMPLSVLGSDHPMLNDPSNLQGACRPCHDRKTEGDKLAGIRASNARRAARKKLPQGKHPGDR